MERDEALMTGRAGQGRLATLVIVAACGVWLGTSVTAQEPAKTPGPAGIESDPMKCWWKTARSAVHVGERFTLALTCGVIETSRVRVVADPNRLDPTAIELTPFEVLGGTRHRDIEAPPWRYFQYSYTVRLLGDEFFGQDVDIPSIQMTYSVQSSSGDGTQGREQLYLLPSLPIRVLSLVPRTVTDIQDASPETFADIEARLFRANGEFVAAGILFAFAVVLAGLAVVRAVSPSSPRVAAVARRLPSSAVLQGCLDDADRLKSEVARDGWTPELSGRALATLRIASAVALGRPVAQTVVDLDVPGREGQLVLRQGMIRPRRALISASTTAVAISGQLANGRARKSDPQTQALLEEIGESLRAFGAARYGRNGHCDAFALDTALDRGMSAIRRLRAATPWPVRAGEALTRAAAGFRETVWSR